ncbi:MAG: ATP-binding protein [Chitinophagaceae bacterium]
MKKGLLILLLLNATFLSAQPSMVYSADTIRQLHNLKDFTYLLRDNAEKFSDADVLSGKADRLFTPLQNLENKDDCRNYWLRFAIECTNPFNRWWLVFKNDQHQGAHTAQNDIADVWYTENKIVVDQQRTGILVPRAQKGIHPAAGSNVVLFSARSHQEIVVYVKVQNPYTQKEFFAYPVILDPTFSALVKATESSLPFLSVVAFTFCILSFFFYFFIREKAYLFFALYTLTLSQHYLILHPDIPFIDWYIPGHPRLVAGFWNLLTAGGLILFGIFGKWFINLASLSRNTDKWFTRFLASLSVLLLVNVLSWMIWFREIIPSPIFLSMMLILAGFVIRFAFFKSVLARLYVGGALWLFVFTILGFLWNSRTIFLPFNPWPMGQVGQLLIYAAALAYKVRLNERARADANRIQEMDVVKSRFFANISHEFRTPLTLIQGPLQQIEEQIVVTGKDDAAIPVSAKQVHTMRRNTDRLLELVNQLLDLSKLDGGSMKLQVVKGDLMQFVKMLAGSFDSMAERKQVHYKVHFNDQSLIGFFDKDKLEKIVVNLLSNAFKYTPSQGMVAVTATIENNRLRLLVDDTGPGIAKKELDKVFDRFYQVEGTEDKGSGIGLALVKELVELYGGQISVKSEPARGTSFQVSLPVGKNDFKEEELVYGQVHIAEPVKPVRENEATVPGEISDVENAAGLPLLLVVEDNDDLRNFIKETVQPFYQVVQAANGSEGLDRAISLIPDIIISDVMMPVMDGFAMTESIKKDERSCHIPVILLTAKAGQAHKIEGLETGADDYLTKPFDARELLTRISNLVNQRKLLQKKYAVSIQLKPSEVSAKSLDEIFLTHIMQAIEKNMEEEDFGVEALASEAAMSRSQLHRKLIALIAQSPSDLIRQTRLLRAKELLEKQAFTPSEVAWKVGFSSHGYFSKCFKDAFGISPSEVKGGVGNKG